MATVVSHERRKVTIQFPDGLADLGGSMDFSCPVELDLDWSKPLITPGLTAHAPPLTNGAKIETNAPEGY